VGELLTVGFVRRGAGDGAVGGLEQKREFLADGRVQVEGERPAVPGAKFGDAADDVDLAGGKIWA